MSHVAQSLLASHTKHNSPLTAPLRLQKLAPPQHHLERTWNGGMEYHCMTPCHLSVQQQHCRTCSLDSLTPQHHTCLLHGTMRTLTAWTPPAQLSCQTRHHGEGRPCTESHRAA